MHLTLSRAAAVPGSKQSISLPPHRCCMSALASCRCAFQVHGEERINRVGLFGEIYPCRLRRLCNPCARKNASNICFSRSGCIDFNSTNGAIWNITTTIWYSNLEYLRKFTKRKNSSRNDHMIKVHRISSTYTKVFEQKRYIIITLNLWPLSS